MVPIDLTRCIWLNLLRNKIKMNLSLGRGFMYQLKTGVGYYIKSQLCSWLICFFTPDLTLKLLLTALWTPLPKEAWLLTQPWQRQNTFFLRFWKRKWPSLPPYLWACKWIWSCFSFLQRAYTEEELNAKLTRRVQKAARRQAKQEELKRLHRAQVVSPNLLFMADS